MKPHYNAFISYSHRKDSDLAPSLERALEKFAKPLFKKRALDIFRDANDLSASPDLWGKIEEGLNDSEYFIFLGSQAAAQSRWCKKEVEHWKAHKSIDNFLIVLTDGELVWDESTGDFDWTKTTAIPDNLSGAFKNEPLYVDFRGEHSPIDLTLENPDFKTKLVLLAATLHHKPIGDMVGEAVTQHKRTKRISYSAISILATLLITSVIFGLDARKQKKEAERQTEIAIDSSESAQIQRNIARDSSKAAQEQRQIAKDSSIAAMGQRNIAVAEKNNALRQTKIAEEQRDRATANYLMSEAKTQVKNDPTLALSLAAVALQINPNDSVIFNYIGLIYRQNNFYKLIHQGNSINKLIPISAAVSPDGTTILLGLLEGKKQIGKVILMDSKGNLIREFLVDIDNFRSANFSPDGDKILVLYRGKVLLYDLKGKIIQNFSISWVTAAALSPNGDYILLGTEHDGASLWDLDGNLCHKFGIDVKGRVKPQIFSVSFSPDGNYVAISDIYYRTYVWGLEGNFIRNLEGGGSVNFSPDGTNILTTSEKGWRLYNTDGELQKEHDGNSSGGLRAIFSPDGQSILAAFFDGTIGLWDLEGNLLQEFKVHKMAASSIAFIPQSNSIMSQSLDMSVRLWGLKGRLIKKYYGHSSTSTVVFSPNGKNIAIGRRERGLASVHNIHLRNLEDNTSLYFEEDASDVSSMAFSLDGEYFITGSTDGIARLWDLYGKLVKEFEDHVGVVKLVAASIPANLVLTVDSKNNIRLWNLSGNLIKEFDEHLSHINSIALSPNERFFLIGSADKTASLYDLKGKLIQKFEGHTKSVKTVTFSPKGQYVLTSAADDTARLWDLNGNLIQQFKVENKDAEQFIDRNRGKIYSIAFSPLGNSVLAGSSQSAFLWDLKGRLIREYKGHTKKVFPVAFSPDGRSILTGSTEEIYLWEADLPLDEFLKSHPIQPLSLYHKKKYGIE